MSNEQKTFENHKGHARLADIIGCAFVAIADRYGVENYKECDSKDEALRFLEHGSEEGMHMDIAVIDCTTNKMVWHKDFLGKKECQKRVNRFIINHGL